MVQAKRYRASLLHRRATLGRRPASTSRNEHSIPLLDSASMIANVTEDQDLPGKSATLPYRVRALLRTSVSPHLSPLPERRPVHVGDLVHPVSRPCFPSSDAH